MSNIRIQLSPAVASELQILAYAYEAEEDAEIAPALLALDGSCLSFALSDAPSIIAALLEISNAADDRAQPRSEAGVEERAVARYIVRGIARAVGRIRQYQVGTKGVGR